MCGICGFTRKTIDDAPTMLNAMLEAIIHRGPDDHGQFLDESIALGHRRLSIIDLSKDGHQPFLYGKDNRYVIVYNGEIYNYLELKEILQAEGHQFFTHCDTEVLAAAWVHWGEDCLQRFNGMFSFAIYDQKEKSIFCARDRFGVKPFYYSNVSGTFAFASEIKQLLELPHIIPKANRNRLAAFLVFGELDSTNETLFDGIFQLSPGSCLTLDIQNHHMELKQWYQLTQQSDLKSDSFAESADQLKKAFAHAVSLRERSDVPVGYCLSGGLDSSSIVCMSAQLHEHQTTQQCIHSASDNQKYDERNYAQMVAKKAGAQMHIIHASPEQLFEQLDDIIWHMDEPFGSPSIFAQWCVFQKANELGLTVMLDGQGADEQLAGYDSFISVWLAEFLRQKEKNNYQEALQHWIDVRHPNSGAIKRTKTLARLYSILPKKLAASMTHYYHCARSKSPFSMTLKRQALHAAKPDRVSDGWQFILDNMRHGMQALLHYEDRNSMAFSIESRVPFLDKDFVETAFAQPLNYKLYRGESKAILRASMKDILPEEVRNRHDKLGFVTPESEWIQENPELFWRELQLACQALHPFIDEKQALQWFDQGGGRTTGDFVLWRIICAGHWAKIFSVHI